MHLQTEQTQIRLPYQSLLCLQMEFDIADPTLVVLCSMFQHEKLIHIIIHSG